MPNRFQSTTLEISLNSKSHRKSAIGNLKIATFKLQISKRRGWDSNPRYSFPYTAFPVLPVQPLLHLSASACSWQSGRQASELMVAHRCFLRAAYRLLVSLAERVGFEPTVPVRVQRFSRPPDSTTLAPLRTLDVSPFTKKGL